MLVYFLTILNIFNYIPDEYKSLSQKAREQVRLRVVKSDREPIYKKGYYSQKGIDFYLTTNLMSSTSKGIKGYAFDNETKSIAIIPNRKKVLSDDADIKTGSFVEPITKDIYKLYKVADDGEVQIFKTKKLDKLHVFRNLHLYTSQPNNNKDTTNEEEEEESNENIGWTIGYTPEDKTTGLSTAYLGYRYYWNKPEVGEDAFELGPIEQNFIVFSVSAGAYAQIFTSFDFQMEDASFNIEADIDLSAMAGLGFTLLPDNNPDDLTFGKDVPIYAIPSLSMYGIKFKLGIYGFVEIGFANIEYKLIQLLKYDYRIKLSQKYHIKYSSKDDHFEITPTNPTFETVKNQQKQEEITKEDINGMYLKITPRIDVGIKATINIGSEMISSEGELTASMFIRYEVPFDFGFDSSKCTFPYLYGQYKHSLSFNFRIFGKLNLLGFIDWEKEFLIPINIFTSKPSGQFCIFDSQNSIDKKFLNYYGDSVYVIQPTSIRLCDDCQQSSSSEAESFFIYLNFLQYGSTITKTFSLPRVELLNSQTKTLNRLFVISNGNSYSKLNYEGYEEDLFLDDNLATFTSFPLQTGINEYCGDDDSFYLKTGVCIKTQISEATKVDLSEEFEKPINSNYIAYQGDVSDSDYIGIITHSEGTPYSSGLKGFQIFDDAVSTIEETQEGEYSGKNPYKVLIKNFNVGGYTMDSVNLGIKLCKDIDSNCITLQNKSYTDFPAGNNFDKYEPVLYLGKEFNTKNNYNAVVTIDIKYKHSIFNSYSISLKNTMYLRAITPLKSHTYNFEGTIEANGDPFSFDIVFEKYTPTIVMNVANLPKNTRAIVTRVFSAPRYDLDNWGDVSISLTMAPSEIYGTIRFFGEFGEFDISETSSIISSSVETSSIISSSVETSSIISSSVETSSIISSSVETSSIISSSVETYATTINEEDKTNEENQDIESGGLDGGAIAGIVIAVIVVVVACAAGVIFYIHKKKMQKHTSTSSDQNKQII
ncbi:hypothetical protein GPJ56_010353 [Histomonas meleagridis]|uniref:uncharacterized protein n=1 Tax=Histomonas meleagridis TaxID=135588 RepID=UPI00355A3AA8|nr:hypothetical protein GPJ56_010353 [Histomonas meleagridis]KAH0797960.1 hypothetical protein GO595_009589 [Histomonas meleagridis]